MLARSISPSVDTLPVVACMDSVSGSAQEIPEYKPIRTELLEMVKYWESTFLDRAFFIFDKRQIGSTDLRTCTLAEQRVNRIIESLGRDAILAVSEARAQFAREVGHGAWKRFRKYLGPAHLHGETAKQTPFQEPHATN